MSLARWDPFLELRSLENRLHRMFRRPFRASEQEPGEFLNATEFAPPVDIYEDEDKLTFKMEIPGIDQNDLDVRLEGNVLTVSGERRFEKEEKQENFRRLERQYGSFCRSFALPASADGDHVTANFENGVLRIDVPKRPEARGKQIPIGAARAAAEKPVRKVA